MERETLTVTFEKTVQIEQYEPEKIGVSQSVVINPEEDPEEVRKELHNENVAFVSREITSRQAAKAMSDGKGDE